jgi:hypothetical protein
VNQRKHLNEVEAGGSVAVGFVCAAGAQVKIEGLRGSLHHVGQNQFWGANVLDDVRARNLLGPLEATDSGSGRAVAPSPAGGANHLTASRVRCEPNSHQRYSAQRATRKEPS